MFSNTLSFLSSCNVSVQVSHPYKTTGKIIALMFLYEEKGSGLYIYIYIFNVFHPEVL